ncbi:amidohydrolase [Winogradskya humida]|uniref:Amidohydrolase n=1 Tax=Winogradskya humida TaxID=113566 RepID=A0ABQ3ZYV3_9ACTN|nr:amidohydrolase family protein [Actinoplanes humidus]GIE23774.1 amidohydrolase [Actinoplanes humidus]
MTTLLVIGAIRTQDPDRPVASALAVAGSRIVAIGDLASVRRELPSRTPILEVPHVTPGFVDSHVHLLWAGRRATRLVLTDAATLLDDLAAHAAAHPGSQWIEADTELDGPLPDATELETAAPGIGVVLDIKGHDALVSTTALRRAGIGPDTPDPAGGRIERHPGGVPTGLLVEHPAVALVRAMIPAPSEAEISSWIIAGQRSLLAHGITTAVDPAVEVSALSAYGQMGRTGQLRMRVAVLPLDLHGGLAETDRLRLGPTKIFLDGGGSLGTALLSTPWPGTDGYHGNQTVSRSVLLEAASGPRGVGVHAVGDAAIDLVLDVLSVVDHPQRSHLIHAYLGPSPAAMARARQLGVAVSAHPALQWDFGAGLVRRLGATRAATANPLRDWLDAGVLVGGGSDGPGPPMSVLHGMWQARTRMVRELPSPLGPDQAVTADEALDLFTTGAAAIAGFGDGRLRVGGPADLTGLDTDPLTPDPAALLTGRVLATVVDGTVEYTV